MFKGSMWAAVAASLLAVGLGGCGSRDSDTITRVSRQNNSGTYGYFREAVLGKDGKFKLGSVDQSGSKDVVELVSKTPSAIGYSGMGYATPEVKMLRISKTKGGEGVAPTVENAKKGIYPLLRPLFIYTLGEPQGAAKHYLDWILSTAGQKVVADQGYVPNPQASSPPTDNPPAGTINVEGSDTMVQLAGSWVETYMKQYPDVRIIVQGGGSGKGIASLINGTINLANASRAMKAKEKDQAKEKNGDQEVSEIVIGMDALGVFVHRENPLDVISLEQLKEIYGDEGTVTKWSQLTTKAEDKKESK